MNWGVSLRQCKHQSLSSLEARDRCKLHQAAGATLNHTRPIPAALRPRCPPTLAKERVKREEGLAEAKRALCRRDASDATSVAPLPAALGVSSRARRSGRRRAVPAVLAPRLANCVEARGGARSEGVPPGGVPAHPCSSSACSAPKMASSTSCSWRMRIARIADGL